MSEAVSILYAKWIPMKRFYQLNCINWTNSSEIFSSFIPAFIGYSFEVCVAFDVFFLLQFLLLWWPMVALKFHWNSIAGLKIFSWNTWIFDCFSFGNIQQTVWESVSAFTFPIIIRHQVNVLQKYERDARR